MNPSALYALTAAVLFGASTPFAKILVGEVSPLLLGGLLYFGSGLGLCIVRLTRDRGWAQSGLQSHEWPWLAGAIVFGGVLGPVALLFGLTFTTASNAALLLNLEAVLTALIAWVVFKENSGVKLVLGMTTIVAGGVVLAWPTAGSNSHDWRGPLFIAIACLCWALDNNLTRKVSASDALFIAGSKGLVAAIVNCSLAFLMGASLPPIPVLGATFLLGFLGYGASLVMFVLALRGLGSARTGAYFSTAPFIGAFVALSILREPTTLTFWIACALMAIGVWLHLSEHHEHEHTHEPTKHLHSHVHDAHHQHEHDGDWGGTEPHEHQHQHTALTHRHSHYPDTHHRHEH
jgi:drug/metabolite transporter (DMT)-like permease